MDADEIRTLLGDNIFERAKKYRKRIQQSTCTVNADGVRHISAMVQGSGGSYYYTQAWLRENGSPVPGQGPPRRAQHRESHPALPPVQGHSFRHRPAAMCRYACSRCPRRSGYTGSCRTH